MSNADSDVLDRERRPPVQRVARGTATKLGLEVPHTARLLAMINEVGADAMIAMMHAKYHYLFWRPVTAIDPSSVTNDGFGPVPGFDDGNPATVEQPGWRPLVTTPNHPEYPSAHATISSAIVEVLTRFLGTDAIDVDVQGQPAPQRDAPLRDRGRPARRGRQRPRLGRAALPLLGSGRLGPGARGRRLRPQPRLLRPRLKRHISGRVQRRAPRQPVTRPPAAIAAGARSIRASVGKPGPCPRSPPATPAWRHAPSG